MFVKVAASFVSVAVVVFATLKYCYYNDTIKTEDT